MNVGDLVNFYTNAWVFKNSEKDYANPGLVIEVDDSHRQCRYTVLWANGRITTEHHGYLKKEKES